MYVITCRAVVDVDIPEKALDGLVIVCWVDISADCVVVVTTGGLTDGSAVVGAGSGIPPVKT